MTRECFNGAADSHPRKPRGARGAGCRSQGASMGPRILIRGNLGVVPAHPQWNPASMGPRILIRGNPCAPCRARSSATRFNGAADSHPRKLLDVIDEDVQERLLQWGRGFSSAETWDADDGLFRLWHCFNGAADSHPRKRSGPGLPLSASRCFNGAADSHPRKHPQAGLMMLMDRELQWGRGFSSAETRTTVRAGAAVSRFNGAADSHPRKRGGLVPRVPEPLTASMGPRILIRGNPEVLGAMVDGPVLQWGRGFSSAETSRCRCSSSSRSPGFNGAADSHPRKLLMAALYGYRLPSLQWGRGFSSAETSGPARKRSTLTPLQWGRGFSSAETSLFCSIASPMPLLQWGRGFSSAETPASDRARPVRWCFNGAADSHPRKRQERLPEARRGPPASMGPRILIRGNHRLDQSRMRVFEASMGPRILIRGNVKDEAVWGIGYTASMGPRILIRGNHVRYHTNSIGMLSFNGAADSHPRKQRYWHTQHHTSSSFNGAADSHPRKRSSITGIVGRRGCFNGAADSHPRKHRPDPPGERGQLASMGPRILIRGNLC